jgi:hypothetical protein
MDPEILFFDEPSAGLDPIMAAGIDDLILNLKKAYAMTMIVVTHELASAFLIADRIILMSARPGRVKADFRVDFPRPRDVDHDGAAGDGQRPAHGLRHRSCHAAPGRLRLDRRLRACGPAQQRSPALRWRAAAGQCPGTPPGLRGRLASSISLLGRFPLSIHQLLFRLAVAGVFFRAGLQKDE